MIPFLVLFKYHKKYLKIIFNHSFVHYSLFMLFMFCPPSLLLLLLTLSSFCASFIYKFLGVNNYLISLPYNLRSQQLLPYGPIEITHSLPLPTPHLSALLVLSFVHFRLSLRSLCNP